MEMTQGFYRRYHRDLGISDLKKGQSIQFMTALDHLGGSATLDEISKCIFDTCLWFNPHTEACYKATVVKGGSKENVMDLDEEKALKYIEKAIKANVVNTTNYSLTSTRRSENSVMVRGWVTLDGNRYSMAGYLAHLIPVATTITTITTTTAVTAVTTSPISTLYFCLLYFCLLYLITYMPYLSLHR